VSFFQFTSGPFSGRGEPASAVRRLYTPLTSDTTFYLSSRDIYIRSAYIPAILIRIETIAT
jgi:hypothetical protein